jgi:hypothetical protein
MNPETERETKSGTAIEECIEALGAKKTQKPVNAEATFIRDGSRLGTIRFQFRRDNLSDLPIVACDSDIMRGFGVMHSKFDPEFDTFTFSKRDMELRITSNDCDFILFGVHLL